MLSRRHVLIALGGIVAFAFALRMVAWFAFPNQIWPDEHFQSLEQAHRVVFGYGIVPWEFREGTRSWILPGFLAGPMAATSVVTSSVTAYLAACAGVLCAIAVVPVWSTFRVALAAFGIRAAIVAAAVMAFWFELVFFAPKALNEAVAGNCLVVGVLLTDRIVRARRGGADITARRVLVASALLALASMLRIQLAVGAFGCFLYLLWPLPARLRWRSLIAGAAVVLLAGLLDWVTWDYPFQSFIENVRINIVVGRSEQYGTASWYSYFEVYARVWGVWGLLVLALAALGARSHPLLAVIALLVLATHIPIGHKEYRFAYPAMILVIALAGIGSAHVVHWVERKKTARVASLASAGLITIWLAASLQGAVGFHESRTRLAVTYGTSQWHWVFRQGTMLATKALGNDPTVCGIGLIGLNVYSTGGYTYLHRPDVHFYETLKPEHIPGLKRQVNVYLVHASFRIGAQFGDFTLDRCIVEACIYRRSGGCEPIPDYHFNEVLKHRGH